MRRLGAVVVLFMVGGCSAIFDMDGYEPRATGDREGSSSSSSGGSSGRLPDGGILDGGNTTGGESDGSSGGIDATADAPSADCVDETEPNNQAGSANPLVAGSNGNCGILSSATDEDFFAFTSTGNGTIGILIPSSVKFEMFKDGASSPGAIYSGGGGVTPISAGNYLVRMSVIGSGTLPAYKLVRK